MAPSSTPLRIIDFVVIAAYFALTLYAGLFMGRFVKNAKDAKGAMNEESFTYGTAKQLTANKFKRVGYRFVGWNTKADGSGKKLKNKASVKKLTTKDETVVKLYAQWKPIY